MIYPGTMSKIRQKRRAVLRRPAGGWRRTARDQGVGCLFVSKNMASFAFVSEKTNDPDGVKPPGVRGNPSDGTTSETGAVPPKVCRQKELMDML
ncbi:unnamed protein product [Arctogadus glacialis]